MTLAALRAAVIPRPLTRNMVISVIFATALIVGLLTMHALNLGGGHHVSGGADHQSAVQPGEMTPGDAGSCLGDCDTHHDLLTMACILALLLVTSLVAVVARAVGVGWGNVRTFVVSLVASAHAPPLPPNRLLLSISRT